MGIIIYHFLRVYIKYAIKQVNLYIQNEFVIAEVELLFNKNARIYTYYFWLT